MSQVTRLLIARHGNTFNTGDKVRRVGTTDLPLVESGLAQGRALGFYLKENRLIPDVIFTSTLQRTAQTAEAAQNSMHTHLPLKMLTIFNEIDYGPDENQPEDKVIARLGKEVLTAWDEHAIVPPGWKVDPPTLMQHWQDFAANLLRDYLGKNVLVITSNGIARFAPYLTGDFEAFRNQYSLKISTGALCLFEKHPSSSHWQCMQWNIRPQRI